MRVAFERRRDLVVELASQIPGLKVNKPQGAFYLFPEVSSYFGKSYGKWTIKDAPTSACISSKRPMWQQCRAMPSASPATYA